jgi:succinate dehydrogenase / fumarate reductase cytochrome b subunit
MSTPVTRPKYLNLLRIKMPVGAIMSIGHRISGVCLFACIPLLAYLLDLSLQGPDQYARAQAILHWPVIQLLTILIVWALAHHLLAGIRFLLLDLQLGMQQSRARASAWLVNVGAIMVVLLYVGALL